MIQSRNFKDSNKLSTETPPLYCTTPVSGPVDSKNLNEI